MMSKQGCLSIKLITSIKIPMFEPSHWQTMATIANKYRSVHCYAHGKCHYRPLTQHDVVATVEIEATTVVIYF